MSNKEFTNYNGPNFSEKIWHWIEVEWQKAPKKSPSVPKLRTNQRRSEPFQEAKSSHPKLATREICFTGSSGWTIGHTVWILHIYIHMYTYIYQIIYTHISMNIFSNAYHTWLYVYIYIIASVYSASYIFTNCSFRTWNSDTSNWSVRMEVQIPSPTVDMVKILWTYINYRRFQHAK